MEKIKEINKIGDNNIHICYLTRNESDSDPDENSLSDGKSRINMDRYNKISYEKEIREWM